MNLKALLQRVMSGFAQAIGWRAANMLPVWAVIVIIILALFFGVNWN